MKKFIVLMLFFILLLSIPCITVAITKFYITNEIILNIGESKKIEYTTVPDEEVKVTWTVDNGGIASISKKGTVVGISSGVTVITAKCGTFSDTCNIYVKEAIDKIEYNPYENYLFGLEPISQYIIENGSFSSDKSGHIAVKNSWLNKDINIVKTNKEKKCNSDIYSLFVSHKHQYSLADTVLPTCEAKGYDIFGCFCGETQKANFTDALAHNLSDYLYDENSHYKKCLRQNCNYITERYKHIFDNNCCIICGFGKKIETEKNLCKSGHTFDNDCDECCNICNFIRTVTHRFDNDCDKNCNICGYNRAIKHIFDGPCDEICNICGTERLVFHSASLKYFYNSDCHFKKCSECSKILETEKHIFARSKSCCKICGYLKGEKIHSETEDIIPNDKEDSEKNDETVIEDDNQIGNSDAEKSYEFSDNYPTDNNKSQPQQSNKQNANTKVEKEKIKMEKKPNYKLLIILFAPFIIAVPTVIKHKKKSR
ncbi:MAG: Ig-like domain-containing protein [Clostridia bacterium]|nr:Ig-like domain-containing protein [Clostridia bacterium]